MTRVIAVTGGKGGVGKTNISLNLALVLAGMGNRVCLFDADLGLANINVLLGIYPEYDLEDVILKQKSVADILIRDYQGIDIIPGSSGVERLANLTQQEIDRVVESFATLDAYDYFILDTSAGISRSVISFCLAASDIALVITPEPTSLTDAYALLKVLCFNGFRGAPKIIVNQCKNTSVASVAYNKLKDVVQKYLTLDIVPLGIIVKDKKFPEAVQRQQPLVLLYPQSSAAKCLQVIAARILANKPEPFAATGIAGFWAKFLAIARTPLTIPDKANTEQNQSESVATEQPLPHDGTAADREVPPETAPAAADSEQPVAASTTAPQAEAHGTAEPATFAGLDRTLQLPSLPHILVRVIEACGDDAADLRDIADIIEKDPALCTRILRMVNSSYYGFSHAISNFGQAVSLLGIDAVRNIAVSASIYKVFGAAQDAADFSLKQFWWHSLMCAVLAQLIAKKTAYAKPDEAFLAGLLHDIGKPLLRACPQGGGGKPEQHIAHDAAGAWLVGRWHLTALIGDAIRYHHEPLERVRHALPLVKIVHVANRLSSASPDAAAAAELLGMNGEDVAALVQQATGQVGAIAQSLDIMIEAPAGHEAECERSDRAAEEHLTRTIRDVSLLQGTLQQFVSAPDADALLHCAYDGLTAVFDIASTHVLLFVHDAEQQILIGRPHHQPLAPDHMNAVTVPTRSGPSMVSAAIEQGCCVDSQAYAAEHRLSILDEQLLRMVEKPGALCFPLRAHGAVVGAAVIGVDRQEHAALQAGMQLLSLFFSQLGMALEAATARQTQTKKILAERLAASSAIARKVAHEVNNPLSIIKNYLKILEIKLADQQMAADELSVINEEIERVAGIVDTLSDFSRPKIQTLATVYLNTLLSDIVKITGQSLQQQHIQIVFAPDAAVPPVISDKNGLKQVFLNLIKNAAEALTGGGTITIATRYNTLRSAVEITVADNGPGLPEPVKNRLFEPYISTKGRGHAGLGLSIVYSTVQELQGTITCASAPGRGTTFTIALPVAPSGMPS